MVTAMYTDRRIERDNLNANDTTADPKTKAAKS